MSLNLVSYHHPSYLCWSDACPMGLGGFDHLGNAWCFTIPSEYYDKECFLSLGDNTSSVRWLHRANIDDTSNLPLFISSQKYAQILLANRCYLYSQHIPGITNNVANALKCRFDLNDGDLTKFVCSTYQHQVHPKIGSWVTYWLQICKEMKVSQKNTKDKESRA